MAALLLLLLVINHAAEKARCSLTWFKDHPLDNRKPDTEPIATTTTNDAPSCALYCSNLRSCSAFFYNQKTLVCDLHQTVFMNSSRLVDAPGYVYYRIMSDDCPISKCYYLLRDGNEYLCVSFFQKSSNNFRDGKALCESQEGHLPILDTRTKNLMVTRMIKSNSENPADFYNSFLGANLMLSKSQFIWFNKKPVPSPSASGDLWNLHRSDSTFLKDCLVLYFTVRVPYTGWNIKSCTVPVPSTVCELKPRRGP